MDDFLYLSRLYGGLDELVQAGGGNISVKNYQKNEIIIKSSGYNLADVSDIDGYTILNTLNLNNFTNLVDNDLNVNIVKGGNPSIETFFHLFLKKYTVHLHPTLINIFMCSNMKMPTINEQYITIDYYKPGIELSNEIYKIYNKENVIFLKNHGVIFTSDSIGELKHTINNCYNCFCNNHNLLLSYEKLLNNHEKKCIYKIPGIYQNKLKCNIISYTPDIAIYLLNSVVNHDGIYYIIGNSKYKCYQIFEVLLSYFTLSENNANIGLTDSQISELISWDKEKYRQTK